ncbi:hypothetical protein SAJA_00125 [Salinisphaera japonica YTM-1]|uniref:Uncharacterized protein n=1 Tax=Salinisphaera japonica YTM-1 TaxID=1209778 RepID=A0A423Q315_9GAMM|nr:hypothetical protein SAJA_00125 [Salinisphaera japonica YTM-1]
MLHETLDTTNYKDMSLMISAVADNAMRHLFAPADWL